MSVTLRNYQTADAAATREVFRTAIQRTASAYYTPAQISAWCPSEWDADAWALARSRAWTVVAEMDGAVVGFCDLTLEGEIDMLFVHPDAAGRGVARALVGQVLEEARKHALPRVATHASRAARPAFERFGFVVDRENHENRIRGVAVPNFDMHKDLG